jgi:hypothetical protein
MENSFIIDFFSCDSKEDYGKLLADYFKLDIQELNELIISHNEDVSVIDIIEKFNIDLNKRYYDQIYIICRHGMTSFDGLESVRSRGLLNLKEVLTEHTPLRQFLLENEVEINIDNRIINVKGKNYPILHREVLCNNCIFTEFKCLDFFDKNRPELKNCKYRKRLSLLEGKLYYDKCETEVFLDGTNKEIREYSTIREYPEILYTLDRLMIYYNNGCGLCSQWSQKENNKFYILQFPTRLENLERMGSKGSFDGYYDIMNELDYFDYSYDDYEDDLVNKYFYENLYLLKYLLYRACDGPATKYGQLYPETVVPAKDIKIIEE